MGTDIKQLVRGIDQSTLSRDEQVGFQEWLTERPHMQISIESALRKRQSVKALLGLTTRGRGKGIVDYSIRISP